jgi:MerR family transcriptional regulator, heat shock protein HspR
MDKDSPGVNGGPANGAPANGTAANRPPANGRLAPGAAGSAARASSNGASSASRAVYVISVAAELAGVHPQTLRVYERKGLLDPSRTTGGSRRFSDGDLARLRRIQDLTAAGLNLEGVRRVLELEGEVARLQSELERVQVEAQEAVARVHRQYRRDLVPFDPAPVPYVPGRSRSGR